MNLNAVSICKNPPHDVNVVIEVPIGGEPIKYEMDTESGSLQIDRFLYTSMRMRRRRSLISAIAWIALTARLAKTCCS